MAMHQVTSSLGGDFEISVGDDGRIADVAGEWPEQGVEFELTGGIPGHTPVEELPENIRSAAASRGQEVCFYDPDGCRTCFCDESGRVLRCVGMC